MRKGLITVSIVVASILLLAGTAAAAGSSEEITGEGSRTLGIVHITFEPTFAYNGVEYMSFGSAFREQWRRLSREKDFKLIQVEAGVTANDLEFATRRLLDLGVDAILVFQHDPYAAGQAVRMAQEAGVPIAIHGIRPAPGINAPFVGFSEYETCRALGQRVAERFSDVAPDTMPRILVLNNETVQRDANRERGFLEGFRSRVPEFEVVANQEDLGTVASALRVTESALLNSPEINIIYATSDQRGFAAAQVIRNGGIVVGEPPVIVAVGGSEAALRNLMEEEFWQAQVALNVRGVAEKSYEVLEMMLSGEMSMESDREFLVDSPIFIDPTEEEVRSYLSENHGIMEFDLQQ